MTSWADWRAGARPKTLPAAIAPVLVGTGVAAPQVNIVRALLALLVALALQVGVNFANDYSDGIKGSDSNRVGPKRLVGSGAATPRAVRNAALLSFLIATSAGLILALQTSLWLILVGAISILAAWGYTGGARPYGYRALGEVSVFIFFGIVAVVGTAYVQTENFSWWGLLSAVPMGSLACAILITNNLRDLPQDAKSGKQTLAVKIGDTSTRRLYIFLLFVAFISVAGLSYWRSASVITLTAGIFAITPMRTILSGAKGLDLIPVLTDTSKILMAFSVFLTSGLTISS